MLKILSVTGFEPAIIQLGDRRLSMHSYHALLVSSEDIEGISLDRSRTSQDMDGGLTLIFCKSETRRNMEK